MVLTTRLPVVYLLSSFASVLLGWLSHRRRGLPLLLRTEHTANSYPRHLEQPNTTCLPQSRASLSEAFGYGYKHMLTQ